MHTINQWELANVLEEAFQIFMERQPEGACISQADVLLAFGTASLCICREMDTQPGVELKTAAELRN